MSKRGSKCPDCNGSHGRGYYRCPTPYKNHKMEDAPRCDPQAESAEAQLTAYFSDEGYSRFGWNADQCGMSPAEAAIDAMQTYDALLKTEAGSQALTAMLYQRLVDARLLPK